MALSSSGIGSNLDVNGIVNQLMSIEQQPLRKLAAKEANYQAKLTAYGSVKGALSSFQGSLSGLSSSSSFQSTKATPSDSTVLSASSVSTATPGNYSIQVTTLAKSQKLASTGFTNLTDSFGSGTITLEFGTYNSGADTFDLNSAKPAKTITIDSAHSSLSGVRDAINAASPGVTASIVNDGVNGYKLVLTSNDTGLANSLRISVADDDLNNTNAAGLSRLVYSPVTAGTKNLTQTQAAVNATLTVDGIAISKASNTISDAIQGVTMTLLKDGGVTTSLSVARDTSAVSASVNKFVKAYNDLSKTLTDLTAYDAKNKQSATLTGDSAVRQIQNQIRNTLNTPIAGSSGVYSGLSQIGVAFSKDGTLAVDATKLQNALSTNATDVAQLFATMGRATDSQISYTSASANTPVGNYSVYVSSLATQGIYTAGATVSSLTVDASNNTLSLVVDGFGSGTVTLTQGASYTGASLAAEMQSKINGDSALSAAGVSVTVTYANSRFSIASNRYGSTSNVIVSGVGTTTAATLGINAASGVVGADAAGSIGGSAATGSGQYLTASNELKILVSGGAAPSDRGSVSYSNGYAAQLNTLMSGFLANNGILATSSNGIDASIKNIAGRRDVLSRRLVDVEARYRAQFSALDVMIGKMNQTSNYLTQQLANLPKAT